MNSKRHAWILLVCLSLLPLTISNESLWIDEGDTAVYASQPNLAAWFSHLEADQIADCQMPLSMFVAWVSGRLIGLEEWQLRLPNLLWGAVSITILYLMGRWLDLDFLPAWLSIQPYFWFYLHEARPYALQLCAGVVLLAGVVKYINASGRELNWALWLGAGIVLLALCTMLAPLSFAAVAVAFAFLILGWSMTPSKGAVGIVLLALLLAASTLPYYLWTLHRGAESAKLWGLGFGTIVYPIYETVGAQGLGPPLASLREAARSGIAGVAELVSPAEAGFLMAFAVLGLGLFIAGARRALMNFNLKTTLLIAVIATFATGLILSWALGALTGKNIWARHLAPVFPFYVLGGYLLLSSVWETPPGIARWISRSAVAGFCILLVISAFSLRFEPSHRNDDYREAAAVAKAAAHRGKVVWWAASWHCGIYYGLDLNPTPNINSPSPMFVMNPTGPLLTTALPELILLSRRDIYDSYGTIQSLADTSYISILPEIHRFQVLGRVSPE